MSEIDRRMVLGGLVAAGGVLGATAAQAQGKPLGFADMKKEADIACLYHVDYGDNARFAQTLNNISNHYSVYASPLDIQIVLVAHSAGVKYFLENLDDTPWKDDAKALENFERASSLSKNGLKVYLCEITFKRLKLDVGKVRKADFIHMVPSGVATVGALQAKGFGYLKVG